MECRNVKGKYGPLFVLAVLPVAMLMLLILASCSEGQGDNPANRTDLDNMEGRYTYEELASMSDGELWELFISCGLVVDDELGCLGKDKLANLFKQHFDSFIEGVTPLNYSGYEELAESAKEVYRILTETERSAQG